MAKSPVPGPDDAPNGFGCIRRNIVLQCSQRDATPCLHVHSSYISQEQDYALPAVSTTGETESIARKEKMLMTEPWAICICSACVSLTLPLDGHSFVMNQSHRAASHEQCRGG